MPNRERFLVSGGTGGIGAAVCAQLAACGHVPLIGYHRQPDAALSLAQRVGGQAIALDLTDPAQIETSCATIAADAAGLAGVVLAASPPPSLMPFGKITADDLALQWQINVVGPQLLLALLVRSCFRAQHRGSVVGVLSQGMGHGLGTAAPNMGAYLIAKHGLLGVLAVAAADYPWLQVRTVSPGFTETPMLAAFDDRFLQAQRQRQPFQTPEQVASEIVDQLLGP